MSSGPRGQAPRHPAATCAEVSLFPRRKAGKAAERMAKKGEARPVHIHRKSIEALYGKPQAEAASADAPPVDDADGIAAAASNTNAVVQPDSPATSKAAASGIAFSTASHPLITGISKPPPTSRVLKMTGIAAAVMKRPSAFAMAAQKATSEIMGK